MTEAAGTPIHHQQYNTEPLTTSSKGKNGSQSTLQIGQAGEQVEVSNLSSKKGMQTSHQDHIAAVSCKISNEPMAKAGQALMPQVPHEHEDADTGVHHQVSPSPNGKSEDVHAVMKKVILPQEEEEESGESFEMGSFGDGLEGFEIPEGMQNLLSGFDFSNLNLNDLDLSSLLLPETGEHGAIGFGGLESFSIPVDSKGKEEQGSVDSIANKLANEFNIPTFKSNENRSLITIDRNMNIAFDKGVNDFRKCLILKDGNDIKRFIESSVNISKLDGNRCIQNLLETGFHADVSSKIVFATNNASYTDISAHFSDNGLDPADFTLVIIPENKLKLFAYVLITMMEDISVKTDEKEEKTKDKPVDSKPVGSMNKKEEIKDDELKKDEQKIVEIGNQVAKKLAEATRQEADITREAEKKKDAIADEKKQIREKVEIEKGEVKKKEKEKEDVKNDMPPRS